MQGIFSEVYAALKKENTRLSKSAISMFDSDQYNIDTIIKENGKFMFKFRAEGRLVPTMLYEYLIVFIEKRLGYEYISSPIFDDQEFWYAAMNKIVKGGEAYDY